MEREYDQREAIYAAQRNAAAETRYASNGISMVGSLSEDATSSPGLVDIIGRAGDIHGNLTDIADALTLHIDRILGPQASGCSVSGDKSAEPPHELGQLRDRIGNLDAAAYRIRNQVERLARL